MFERFTERARCAVVLAQEEARGLRHNYIGTEHILLGLIAEHDGAGAQILAVQAGDIAAVRTAVIELIPGAQETVDASEALRATPAVEAILTAAARLAGPLPVGSHHLLLAALDDPSSAAARALETAGVDLDRARTALRDVDIAGTSGEPPDQEAR